LAAAPLDTVLHLATPEGVPLVVSPAGPVPRLYAWTIDLLLRGLIYALLGIALGMAGGLGMGLLLVLLFAGEWFYPVLFEVLRHGATPGKQMMGLRVICDDGAPVGWHASMIRNLLRSVDMLPITYAFGLISMLLSREFKRLGDIVAGTLVVYNTPLADDLPIPAAPPILPPAILDDDEQQAIVDFATRSDDLTPERRNELARLASPLIGGREATAQSLLSFANWISGRRTP
jgi:uncharacterized RDD family membrane protein YckC